MKFLKDSRLSNVNFSISRHVDVWHFLSCFLEYFVFLFSIKNNDSIIDLGIRGIKLECSPQDRNWIRKLDLKIKKQHWTVLKQLRTYVFPFLFTLEIKSEPIREKTSIESWFLGLKVCFPIENVCARFVAKSFLEIRYWCDMLCSVFFNSQKKLSKARFTFLFPQKNL